MNRLYLIEGVPGSGKTTLAKKLAARLAETGAPVHLFVEGDLHPADMAWCALLTKEEYARYLLERPALAAELEKVKTDWRDYAIVAYTRLPPQPDEVYAYFASKEVYDGRVSADMFREIHLSRWAGFGREAEGVYAFECALMQNAYNELKLYAQSSDDEIAAYIAKLLASVQRLNPVIIYLDIDARACIERASAERLDARGGRAWESRVTEYIADSPYGKSRGLTGVEGMLRYFVERQRSEINMLRDLPAEVHVLSAELCDQEARENALIERLIADGKGYGA